MKRFLIAIVACVGTFALITYWALESGGVAIAETTMPDGAPRATHVWFVSDAEGLWLEAGTKDNGWYRDVLSDPQLALVIDGKKQLFIARPEFDPEPNEAHPFIRSLIRDKYGFRDRWVGLLVDTSESVAVRLVPVEPSRRSTR